MKQQEVLKKIGVIITELTDQFQYLTSSSDALNELELELFVANANFLTEHAEILRKVNAQQQAIKPALPPAAPPTPPVTEKSVLKGERFFEPVVQHVKAVENNADNFTGNKVDPKSVKLELNTEDDAPAGAIDLGSATDNEEFSFIRRDEASDTIRHELTLNESDLWDEDEELPEEKAMQIPTVKYDGIRTSPVDETPSTPEPVIDQTNPFATPIAPVQPDKPGPKPVEVPPVPLTQPGPKPVETPPTPAPIETPPTPKPVEIPPTPEPIETPPASVAPAIKPIEIKAEPVAPVEEKPLTINQRMSALHQQQQPARLHEQAVGSPIADLKSSISLNDKMLYVKDLFNGYSLAYSEAIDIVNRFKTFDEAESFLKSNYATKNGWDNKPATTEKFYSLLRRRFA